VPFGVSYDSFERMSWVCVTSAQSLPSALRTEVCQTIVVRPRWSATDSPVTVVPTRAPAMNFVLESVALHRGRTTMVWQTSVRNAEGKLCALVTQTQLVLSDGS